MCAAVLAEEAEGENWDLNGVMTVAEAEGSRFRGKYGELQTACWAVLAGLVNVVQMAKRCFTIEEQLRESNPELQEIQR